jgi:hypothetical protein
MVLYKSKERKTYKVTKQQAPWGNEIALKTP